MKKRSTLLTLLSICLMLVACDTKTKNVDSCGDGFVDPGEECDGLELGGESCASLGHYNTLGTLSCTDKCQFAMTDCGGACGDSIVDGPQGEQCDGGNLNSHTCITLGFAGGALVCGADCRFDLGTCQSLCGNGLKDPTEECDDGNAQSDDGCSNTCLKETGFNCTPDNPSICSPICGDEQVVGEEECDGTEFGDKSCADFGFIAGELVCTGDCQIVFSNCNQCGNNTIDVPEVCDGTSVNGQTCVSLGFIWGSLVCNASCSAIDTTTCQSTDTITMVLVPVGTFQRDATPTNLSTVSAFQISEREITRAQWTVVTGWADPSDDSNSSGTGDPVQQVSWYDAIAFCNKLSLQEGLTPVYTVSGVNFSTLTYAEIPTASDATWNAAMANWAANGYRLPTEMEWMWAAMGAGTASPGVTNTTGYLKAFAGSTGSNDIWDYAWYSDNSSWRTHQAGSKIPNELGLYDMSGNVYEWTWDWYSASYPAGTQTDYRGPASGTERMLRGGSSESIDSGCTVAYRFSHYPYIRWDSFGFRVVRN